MSGAKKRPEITTQVSEKHQTFDWGVGGFFTSVSLIWEKNMEAEAKIFIVRYLVEHDISKFP